ncbi:MAG: ribose 5-phosphate isomerase A [Candidatus Heimdallarchaeota archaeon]
MSNVLIEQGKKAAAFQAVEDHVRPGMVIGIGSGSTIVHVVEHLVTLNQNKDLALKCVPTSYQSEDLIIENGFQLVSLDEFPTIDLAIDGADEIDHHLNAIKGGGGCLVREKIVAANAKNLVLVADYRKHSQALGEKWKKGVPIEIIPFARSPLIERLRGLGGKPALRQAQAKMGPLVTDNGNFIIDVDFGIINNPTELQQSLLALPGVVDTGLFIGMASVAYIGQQDGMVLVLSK